MRATESDGVTAVADEPKHVSRFRAALRRQFGSPREASRRALRWLLAILAFLWVCLVLSIVILWAVQTMDPTWLYLDGRSFIGAFRLLILSVLLVSIGIAAHVGRRAQHSRARAAATSWTLGLAFLFLMVALRVFGPIDPQIETIAQSLVGLVFVCWLFIHAIRRQKTWTVSTKGMSLAAAFGALLVLPWLVVGALGSLIDTALAFLAGAVLGLVASWIISYVLFPAFLARRCVRRGDVLLGGMSAAVLLLILAGNYGTGTLPPVLLLELPALGWLIAVVVRGATIGSENQQESWPAVAVLVGIVTGGTLAFVDPSALGRLMKGWGPSEWLVAPLIASLVAVLLAILTAVLGSGRLTRVLHAAGWRMPVGLGMIGCGIFLALGHPGFHGGHMLVVLRDQADLSGIGSPMSLEERRQSVFSDLVSTASTSQSDLRRSLDRIGLDYTPYYIVNAVEASTADFPIRWWLERRPDVDHVEPTDTIRPMSGSLWTTDSQASQPFPETTPWNLRMTRAKSAWELLLAQGEGITIGHIDSGADLWHPELSANYRGWDWGDLSNDYNWYDPAGSSPQPVDPDGHGTGTLSAAVGQHVGVAPRARWISCASSSEVALPTSNAGRFLSCLQFMLAPFPIGGDPIRDGSPWVAPNILTISLGVESAASTIDRAMQAFRAAGAFVVVSAGNDGLSPGWYQDSLSSSQEVLSVGAVNEDGTLSSFSSGGAVGSWQTWTIKPELVAPGEQVLVAAPAAAYVLSDGTSFAAPQVAGVVALMWSAEPNLIGDIVKTKDILEMATQAVASNGTITHPVVCSGDATCFTRGGRIVREGYGFGIVDGYEAVFIAKQDDESPK